MMAAGIVWQEGLVPGERSPILRANSELNWFVPVGD